MPRPTIVYKVVLTTGHRDMCSFTAKDGYRREYHIGEKTLPVEGTPLFAFDRLKSAKAWTKSGVVIKCKATGVRLPNLPENFNCLPCVPAHYDVWSGWKRRKINRSRSGMARHTWRLCESLTPIEII
jgi:hypothetical protein